MSVLKRDKHISYTLYTNLPCGPQTSDALNIGFPEPKAAGKLEVQTELASCHHRQCWRKISVNLHGCIFTKFLSNKKRVVLKLRKAFDIV